MTELVKGGAQTALTQAMALSQMAPGNSFSYRPHLTSSDRAVQRSRDGFAADAQDASRTNPFARSALRTVVDSVIGFQFNLQLELNTTWIGIDTAEADVWCSKVEKLWESLAASSHFHMDAQRKQTFAGLMRLGYSIFFTSGEVLASVEWKPTRGKFGCNTCLLMIAPERLSDPYGAQQFNINRRMGVELDVHGAPIAYHIREQHPADEGYWGKTEKMLKWKRYPRFTSTGRPMILHYFAQDQADMTRGLSSFTTALLPLRLLQDYLTTELESAGIRATYAAVIQSQLDYEEAMNIIGADTGLQGNANPIQELQMKMMSQKAAFYKGQEFKFGKAKVAHLLPNEELKMVQGTQSASAMKDFASINSYLVASGTGVDYTALTKDFSATNYSGARAALFDVWRSYEVRRSEYIDGFAKPFFFAVLEEQVKKNIVPLPGDLDFDTLKDLLSVTFSAWNKPMLDPLKEIQAEIEAYNIGASSLKDICSVNGKDWESVLVQRKREKDKLKELDLKPEDIMPELMMNIGAQNQKAKNGASGADSSPNGSGG